MIANLLGWWIFAGLVLLLAVLLTSILIFNLLNLGAKQML
jgi:ABC-type multidrug transport system permease subunit